MRILPEDDDFVRDNESLNKGGLHHLVSRKKSEKLLTPALFRKGVESNKYHTTGDFSVAVHVESTIYTFMASQPTPPLTYPPPRNKGLIRPY